MKNKKNALSTRCYIVANTICQINYKANNILPCISCSSRLGTWHKGSSKCIHLLYCFFFFFRFSKYANEMIFITIGLSQTKMSFVSTLLLFFLQLFTSFTSYRNIGIYIPYRDNATKTTPSFIRYLLFAVVLVVFVIQ